jgi:cell wall-associated NlpC family hydrolase
MPIPFRSPPRRLVRPLTVLAGIMACSRMAGAQGPSQPKDPKPAVTEAPASDGARLLAANLARLTAAYAPRPVASSAPKPFAAWSISAQAFRDSILLSVVRTALGTRYVHGGESFEGGFDCSGLVKYVMTALHVSVPRTAAKQADTGLSVGREATRLRPGDLLTFGKSTRGISHVGIYVGNGRFVHASSVAGQVIESDIERGPSPLIKPWRGTRRVLSSADADSSATGGS